MTRAAGKARLAAIVLAFASAVLWAGPAHAGTPIQLGEVGPATTCLSGSSFVQVSVGAPPSYSVPAAGTITSWSHQANDSASPGTGRLQVWRPAGGTSYTLVGRSGLRVFETSKLSTFATDIPVKAGDVLGLRLHSGAPACLIENDVDVVAAVPFSADPKLNTTLEFPPGIAEGRVNVSATLDPTDAPPPPSAGPTSLDSSKTKGKQPADKLKIKVTADQDGTLDVAGKGKVAQRKSATTSAKTKNYKLKRKRGIGLQAGVKKTIRLKFKNNRKTVKRITKLLKRSKKARKGSKVTVSLTATTTAGVASTSKLKIKLKP